MNYCTSCGNKLREGASFCTKCGKSLKVEKRFCTACGKELNENEKFCTACGKSVDSSNLNQVNTQTNNQVQLPIVIDKPVGKTRTTAAVLAIFFGMFGVHNFYLGFYQKAAFQLCLTLLSFFLFSPMIALWGIVEGILIISNNIDKDAKGNLLIVS